jgi:hypothetical protein
MTAELYRGYAPAPPRQRWRPAARRCSTSSRWQADDGPAGVLPGHGPGVVEKAESGYGKVQADLTVMRRARELPYDWLADNTRWQRKPRTFDSVEDALRNTAAFYRKALWNEADSYVEIWLEKDARLPVSSIRSPARTTCR